MSIEGYPSDFFYVNKVLQKVTGLWLPGREISLVLRVLYYFSVFIAYSITIFFFICEFIIFRETVKDFNKFVSQFGMLFTHVIGVLKFYLLVFRRRSIKKIMDALQDKNYVYEAVDTFQPGLMLFKAKQVTSWVSVLVFILYAFVGMSAHISSTITINGVVKGNNFPENMTCYDFLPYYFHIPFNADTKYQCQVAFTFMNFSLDVFAFIIAVHDGLFVTLLNCLKTQIEIVQTAFQSIRVRGLRKLNLPNDYDIFLDENNPELEKTIYEELSRCTKHLNILLQLCEDIENIFTLVTLAQTLASLIIFASCLYVASTVSMTSPEFFAQVEYFLCVLVQLSLICYFGNEITIASERTRQCLYESDWLSSSLRFKKSMILTMCRMQRPVYLSIGKFSPLTLATLVAVCRGSFSYFALFKSIQ